MSSCRAASACRIDVFCRKATGSRSWSPSEEVEMQTMQCLRCLRSARAREFRRVFRMRRCPRHRPAPDDALDHRQPPLHSRACCSAPASTSDFDETRRAVEASGAEIVTVAIRRDQHRSGRACAQPSRCIAALALRDAAQHGWLLHGRRRGPHVAARPRAAVHGRGSRRKRRPHAGQARGTRRSAYALSQHARDAEGRGDPRP